MIAQVLKAFFWDKGLSVTSISIMETMASSGSIPHPREPANYDEVSMQQSLLFSDSLKDLKNLRKQLYSAAEYFELSYTNDDAKQIVINTLKDYSIKALVNTVDHLGSVSYKVNDLLDEKVDEVFGTETRVSCIEQRLRTCQTYIDREGLSQQSLVINTPKYHKHYILPAGEMKRGANQTKLKYEGCSLDDQDDWHEFKNGSVLFVLSRCYDFYCSKLDCGDVVISLIFSKAVRATIQETPPSSISEGWSQSPSLRSYQQPGNFLFTGNMSQKDLEKRTVSPHRFPLLRSGSFSSRPTTPNSRQGVSFHMHQYHSEPRESGSVPLHADRGCPRETDQIPSKSKRLLKALLSRRKLKKDDMLHTYLDEY